MTDERPSGYIRLSRKQFDGLDLFWGDGTKYDSRSAWTDLIQLAAWKPYKYRGVDALERGEFVASIRFLAERWKWPKSTVLDWLKRCALAGRIVGRHTGHHGRVYRIVNYDAYQDTPSADRTDDRTDVRALAGQNPDSGRTNENTVKPVKRTTALSGDADVTRVIQHYLAKHPNRRPGAKEASIIARALKTYTVPELCEAIDGNADDEWCIKNRKHELGYVLRNNDLIDTYRAKATVAADIPDWIKEQHRATFVFAEREAA